MKLCGLRFVRRTSFLLALVWAAAACRMAMAAEYVSYGTTVYEKWWLDVYLNNHSSNFAASLQVLVSSNAVGLLCRGVNKDQHPIIASRMSSRGNDLVFNYGRKIKEREWASSPEIYIPPNGTSSWFYSSKELSRIDLLDGLARVEWRFKTIRSNPLWMSSPVRLEQGKSRSEELCSSNRLIISRLAYVPGTTNGGEIAFFLWNGTSQSVDIGNFSVLSNRLHVVAAPIKVDQTLDVRGFWPTNLLVLPQASAQWSVPLMAVISLIPKSAISSITTAGGCIDLVWGLDGCESAALPICIGERPKTPYEQYVEDGAEFLKKWDGVRKMNEKSNLAISLRMAGGGNEPLLVERVVNEESENLVGGFYMPKVYNCGNNYYIASKPSAKVVMGGYFLVQPKEALEYIVSPSWMREMMRLSGRVLELDVERDEHRYEAMWLAFPDKAGKINEVRANREPSSPAILAFAYSGETNSGFAFVLWNKTAQPLSVTNLNNRIVLSVPAMDYKREFKLDGVEFARGAIATNKHEACFVPWDAVMKQIPSEDLARLIKAGGEVDLTWKIGVWESRPLPLLLGSGVP